MKKNKGSILLEALIALTIISICSMLVYNTAKLVYQVNLTNSEFSLEENMKTIYKRLTRCLIYCKASKDIMDILP